jgi:hypothetical protein
MSCTVADTGSCCDAPATPPADSAAVARIADNNTFAYEIVMLTSRAGSLDGHERQRIHRNVVKGPKTASCLGGSGEARLEASDQDTREPGDHLIRHMGVPRLERMYHVAGMIAQELRCTHSACSGPPPCS